MSFRTQLATGKGGNPLTAGKPFINNLYPMVVICQIEYGGPHDEKKQSLGF